MDNCEFCCHALVGVDVREVVSPTNGQPGSSREWDIRCSRCGATYRKALILTGLPVVSEAKLAQMRQH